MTQSNQLESERSERILAVGYDYQAQVKTSIQVCNLCGCDAWTVIAYSDRYGYRVQTTACSICGLTVINPRMIASAYAEFYADYYRPLVSAYHGRTIDAQSVKVEQALYAQELSELLVPFLGERSGDRLLDVGGSTGVVALHLMKRFQISATVLDPSPQETLEAQRAGLRTIQGLVEDWSPDNGKYDIVGLFQTADHLLDLTGTLAKLRSVIAEDGLFVVDIVDFRHAYLKHWSIEAAIKIDHPYSLTEGTMEAALARTGFFPMRKAYSADKHLVAYVCKPVPPNPSALPSMDAVEHFFRELRLVQSTVTPALLGRS